MPRYILQTMTADGLPMYYDGAFFTLVREKAYVFDDDDAEGRRDRAEYFFDRIMTVIPVDANTSARSRYE
jgi:hypothetical protein